MRVIWKYPLHPGDNMIEMPLDSRPLHVDMQGNEPCMWVLVPNSEALLEKRRFKVYGTGHEIIEACHCLRHVATFLMGFGALVWHVFEVTNQLD